MTQPKEFVDFTFYEELFDKECDISSGLMLAVLNGSEARQRNESMVLAVCRQLDGVYEERLIAIQYLHDFCRRTTQEYARFYGDCAGKENDLGPTGTLWRHMVKVGYRMQKAAHTSRDRPAADHHKP